MGLGQTLGDLDGDIEGVLDRQGSLLQALTEGFPFVVYPRLSPDGTQVAVSAADQETDVWVWDLGRQALTRLTVDPAVDVPRPSHPTGQAWCWLNRRQETEETRFTDD